MVANTIEQSMGLINRFLGERAEAEKYATVFHCTLESDGRLRYVNAGHCAPLVVSLDGATRQLETTGMPVGLIPTATFPAAETTVVPGDKVVIYSDGVSEARRYETAFLSTHKPDLPGKVEENVHDTRDTVEALLKLLDDPDGKDRAAKLGRSSDGTGAPLGRGSHRNSHSAHRVRTACHSSKSCSVNGRRTTRWPCSSRGGWRTARAAVTGRALPPGHRGA